VKIGSGGFRISTKKEIGIDGRLGKRGKLKQNRSIMKISEIKKGLFSPKFPKGQGDFCGNAVQKGGNITKLERPRGELGKPVNGVGRMPGGGAAAGMEKREKNRQRKERGVKQKRRVERALHT